MDMILLGVAGISLVVALVFGVAAWRLARDNRARSAARVAALAASVRETDSRVARPAPRPVSAPVSAEDDDLPASWTFPSRVTPLVAAPRTHARAQELAIRSEPAAEASLDYTDVRTGRTAEMRDSFLSGGEIGVRANRSQRSLAVAATALLILLAGAGMWMVFDAADGARSAATAPLELVSLRHERQGSKLAVSGLVRNPVAGPPVDRLSAVVFLFDQNGTFVTSAQSSVDFLKLAPGDESPFVIQLDAPASVTRYRVSFRTDGGVVPHVDRRGQSPVSPASLGSNGVATL